MRKGEGNKSNWFSSSGLRLPFRLSGSNWKAVSVAGEVGRSRVGGEIAQSESQKKKRKMKKENEKKRRDETI